MSKPEIRQYLGWPDLHRWFEKKYPAEFNYEAVNDWLSNGRTTSNGELVTASGEVLDEEFDPDDYEPFDHAAVKFFMQRLHEEFPEAVDQYGDVKVHFWW